MKVIDSDNYAASGIQSFFFPGGEPHARIPEGFGDALLFLKARTWDDVGRAVAVLDALQEQDATCKVWLFAAYFPGARQDRSDGQTPCTASLMLHLLYYAADRIYTFDAHSNAVGNLVDHNFTLADLIDAEYNPADCDFHLISPDKGAIQRTRLIAAAARTPHPVICCDKVRDFATGTFLGFSMPALTESGEYVITDDICDGGGTFNLLAEEFHKNLYAAESMLVLYVSHGIFSKGVDAIDHRIAEIYTTDSWCRPEMAGGRLRVVSLQPIIDKILERTHV